ncbi:hypothetical protein ACFWVC_37570 [Streptomyces sp. NPDC058691]|uniref:hypothetical protein n=1 Tax=Streptomyces sp. NPDC058691 TaxID=3346601 RepID=UPI0036592BA8
MVFITHSARDIEATARALQDELQRLEAQQHGLERELAAVVAHLGSVRRALGALRKLMPSVPLDGITDEPHEEGRQVPPTSAGDLAATAEGAPVAPAAESAGATGSSSGTPPGGTRDDRPGTAAHGNYGWLTEQILEYLATTGGTEVRARDVAAALGRDTNAGSINAVRSTLDRLVGASRVRRTGRGLYRSAS